MAYYADLTPYSYDSCKIKSDSHREENNTLNIGWLDCDYDYIKGNVSELFKSNLLKLCIYCKYRHRGFHCCNICGYSSYEDHKKMTSIYFQGKEHFMGSGILFLEGEWGIIYVAPNLIYHYIEKHNYKPPEEFIKAVENIEFFNTELNPVVSQDLTKFFENYDYRQEIIDRKNNKWFKRIFKKLFR